MSDELGLHTYDNYTVNSATNSSYINESVNENIINEHFWYSKPMVMNLTTQQIFFQLSTENNGII